MAPKGLSVELLKDFLGLDPAGGAGLVWFAGGGERLVASRFKLGDFTVQPGILASFVKGEPGQACAPDLEMAGMRLSLLKGQAGDSFSEPSHVI